MAESDKPLLEVRPSWWNYFWHFVFFWLLFVPVIVALVRRRSLVLKVYEDRVHFQKGFFGRETKDIFISDIRGVEVRQSLFQRLVGIGGVVIDTAGSDDEIVAAGLPGPKRIRDLVLGRRRAGRENRAD